MTDTDKKDQTHNDNTSDDMSVDNLPVEAIDSRDPYGALHFRDFRLLFIGTFIASVSVVGGGIGTIIVVLLVALLSPEMRRLGSLIPGKR